KRQRYTSVDHRSVGRRLGTSVEHSHAAGTGRFEKNDLRSRRGTLSSRGDQPTDVTLRRARRPNCAVGQALCRSAMENAQHASWQVEGIRCLEEWCFLRCENSKVIAGFRGAVAAGNWKLETGNWKLTRIKS